jgi:hypothetical protein
MEDVAIWSSLWPFGIFFPVLVCCAKKNLATLIKMCFKLKTALQSAFVQSTNMQSYLRSLLVIFFKYVDESISSPKITKFSASGNVCKLFNSRSRHRILARHRGLERVPILSSLN